MFSASTCRSCCAPRRRITPRASSRKSPPAAACRKCILPGSGSSSLLFSCLPRLLPIGVKALALARFVQRYQHIVETLLGNAPLTSAPQRRQRGKKLFPSRDRPVVSEPRPSGAVASVSAPCRAGSQSARRHLLSALFHEFSAANSFAVDGDALLADVRRVRPTIILLVNPNNPTGRLWPRQQVIRFLDQLPAATLTVVDEAYLDYADAAGVPGVRGRPPPQPHRPQVHVKVHALSGARVSLISSADARRAAQAPVRGFRPWPVGLLAQAAAMEAPAYPSWYLAKYAERLMPTAGTAPNQLAPCPVPSSVNFF